MPTETDPYQAEPDDHRCTDELDDEDGAAFVICQEPVGAERVVGGGEYPDPNTPARAPAPGAVEDDADGAAGDDDTGRVEPRRSRM